MRSAHSSCRQRTRRAEQRWPAESKADWIVSPTTCSARAEESTTSAFSPPVSAISGSVRPEGLSRPASCSRMSRATAVDPVNTTPAVCGSPTSTAPTDPSPGRSCRTPPGMPASRRISTIRAAISGVSSAGLASTVLPAPSAAATWPVKIASGKFHGLMQTTGPSGRWVSLSKLLATSVP